jgi:hypothetical protein
MTENESLELALARFEELSVLETEFEDVELKISKPSPDHFRYYAAPCMCRTRARYTISSQRRG